MTSSPYPDPQPAWMRAFNRVKALIGDPAKADLCKSIELAVTSITYDLDKALLARDYRTVDRLADEFREIGRHAPMCPRIGESTTREEVERKVREAREKGLI